MAKAPQSNLPPQAQPWGRYIEGKIADLTLDAGLIGQDSSNTLKQLNGAIQLLSDQVKYLSGLKTYYTSYWPSTFGGEPGLSGSVLIRGLSIEDIVLPFDSVIIVTATGRVMGGADSNNIGQSLAKINFTNAISVSGGPSEYSSEAFLSDNANVNVPSHNVITEAAIDDTFTNTKLVQLNAGTYTITSSWSFSWNITGAGSSNYFISDTLVAATIIGKRTDYTSPIYPA